LRKLTYFLLFSIVLFYSLACNKLEEYDDRPIILESSYTLLQNAQGKDTSLVLKFTFTDGDGNVGLSTSDTMPPYDTNVKIDYLEKIDGEFTKILIPGTTDTLNFNSRIKSFGSNTATKAEVEVKVNISVVLADTVKFDYYILDKSLNRSNKVSTGTIVLNN
jgi:hypothetical protein